MRIDARNILYGFANSPEIETHPVSIEGETDLFVQYLRHDEDGFENEYE